MHGSFEHWINGVFQTMVISSACSFVRLIFFFIHAYVSHLKPLLTFGVPVTGHVFGCATFGF